MEQTNTKHHKKSTTSILVVILLMFVSLCCYSSGLSKKDSILLEIKQATKPGYLNSIQTSIGPQISKLVSCVNDLPWNEPDVTIDIMEELIPYAIQTKNDSLLSWVYHYKALSYYNMHFWNISIEIYQDALTTNWALNSPNANSFKAFCALNIGCNYEQLGTLDKAAEFYYKSIELNEENNIPYVVAEAKLDVASLNIRLKNYNKARTDLEEALIVLSNYNDSIRISEAYRMLSSIAVAERKFEEAKEFFQKARKIAQQTKDNERLVKIHLEYGQALYSQKKYNKALKTLKTSQQYCVPTIFPSTYFQVLAGIGKIQTQLRRYDLAEEYLLKAHKSLDELLALPNLLKVEENLAELYAIKGEVEKFQQYYQLANAHKDSIAAKEKMRSIAESEVKYQTTAKQRKIELQQVKLESRKKQIALLSTIALILLLGLIVVLRLLQRVRTKNKELLHKNIELSEQWEQLQNSFKAKEKKPGRPSLFQRIYKLVAEEEGFNNSQLSVDFLASELGSNVKYISNAIKENTNMNFNAFVNTFRIEKAKTLLRSSEGQNLSLEAISEQCGFNNQTTFYQKFKSITGLTPSVYRKIEE